MKMTNSVMWTAVVERSVALDGKFVYAVKTTGVYCRSTCASRRPKEANVEFFDSPEAARSAGYRSCRRCCPDDVRSRAENMVEQICTYIEGNLDGDLSLDALSQVVGMSPYHVQRTFKRTVGVSPREFAAECRVRALKKGLKNGASVTAAMYDAGYGSSSRLYEGSDRALGMTPGAYARGGAGETLYYAFVETRLGLVLLAASTRGICFLQFGERDELMAALREEFSAAAFMEDAGAVVDWLDAVRELALDDVPVDLRGTAFQQAVWRYLRSIPAGTTQTYKEVAEAIGRPAAVRAVASACASNRIAVAVPCHRVLRTDGGLGGYRWHLDRKVRLLKDEAQ